MFQFGGGDRSNFGFGGGGDRSECLFFCMVFVVFLGRMNNDGFRFEQGRRVVYKWGSPFATLKKIKHFN
jgi:hypothetical protein